MFLRLFLRTFLNTLFENNFIINFFVKICNKKPNMSLKHLKKKSNVPINKKERSMFFQSFTGDILDCNN
jgi:hypothetical protein